MTLGDYVPLFAMMVLGGLFAGLSLVVSGLLAPRHPTPAKLAAYECGIVIHSALVRRDVVLQAGGFDETLHLDVTV